MLTINVSGWKKGYGPYDVNLPFDEQKTDYQIHFKDGERYAQVSPFETETHDWNNDGDVYPQYGAWFRSQNGRGEFFTPVDLLRLVQEKQAEVTGMVDPLSALNGYIKAKEEEQAAKKAAEAKSYPVSRKADGIDIPLQQNQAKRRPADRER